MGVTPGPAGCEEIITPGADDLKVRSHLQTQLNSTVQLSWVFFSLKQSQCLVSIYVISIEIQLNCMS